MSKVHRWGKWEWGMTLILFLLLTARACAWGMEYWPQLEGIEVIQPGLPGSFAEYLQTDVSLTRKRTRG